MEETSDSTDNLQRNLRYSLFFILIANPMVIIIEDEERQYETHPSDGNGSFLPLLMI